MIILKRTTDLLQFLSINMEKGLLTGFVPTMGALHSGHISLLTQARANTACVVCSIFVNPTQFNDPKDFEKYPVTIEQDIYLLEKAGCDVLFLPEVEEIYPDGIKPAYHFELGFLETVLDGKYRPGHFQGVCQVMDRLLHIVKPGKLFMGQKDYQQCLVLKKLTAEKYPFTQLIICTTQRESDGLAMSSRNTRLNKEERARAVSIYRTLQFVKENIKPGDVTTLKYTAEKYLTDNGFKVDYVEIAEANTLQLISNWDGKEPVTVLIAAFLNEVRLIDNIVLT